MRALLILIFLPVILQAQVSIQISSEIPFILAIDGYIQNTEEVKALQIEKLDTGAHQLIFQLRNDQRLIEFNRQLKLVEPGIHKFIVSRNFEGRHQLRYRGETSVIPAGIIKMNQQKILEIQPGSFPVLPPPPPPPPTITELKTIEPEIKEADQVVTVKIDSINISTSPIVNETAIEAEDKLDNLRKKIKEAEFEFIKLNLIREYLQDLNSVNTADLKELLKMVSYDNSRMLLIREARENLKDPENLSRLSEEFDYELSREDFKTKYLK